MEVRLVVRPVCAFDGHYNGSKRIGLPIDQKVHLHRFPKTDCLRRALWLDKIQRSSNKILNINFETCKYWRTACLYNTDGQCCYLVYLLYHGIINV